MKRLINLTLFISLSILLITSCTKAPENISVLPKEANLVTVYNIPELINKGDLFNANQLETVQKVRSHRKDLKKEEIKLIDRIFEKPLSIGLNYEKDWFSFYLDEDENEERYFGMALSVIQEEALTDFMNEFLEVSGAAYEIKDAGNYKYTLTDKRTAFAWDKEKLLILAEESYRGDEKSLQAKMEYLFGLTPENQLIKEDGFKSFYKEKKDISLWVSSNLFKDEIEFKEFEEEYQIIASDNYLSFYLTFDEGQVDIDASFKGNQSIEELIDENKVLADNFNTAILAHFSEDNLGLIALSINPSELFERIKDNRMVSMGNMSKVTPQEFLENMEGSIAFVVSNIEGSNASYDIKPSVALVFDIKDKELLEELMSIIPAEAFEEKSGYYQIKTGAKENAYLAFNSSVCLLSNKEAVIKAFKAGESVSNNLADSPIASAIDDNGLYINLLLDETKLSKGIRESIEREQTTAENELMKVLLQLSESIDYKLSNKNKTNLSLKIRDKEQNSLKVIIQTLDENFDKLEQLD